MPKKEDIQREFIRKDHQCGVRLTEQEFKKIQHEARASGFTVSSYIREIVLAFLKENE